MANLPDRFDEDFLVPIHWDELASAVGGDHEWELVSVTVTPPLTAEETAVASGILRERIQTCEEYARDLLRSDPELRCPDLDVPYVDLAKEMAAEAREVLGQLLFPERGR